MTYSNLINFCSSKKNELLKIRPANPINCKNHANFIRLVLGVFLLASFQSFLPPQQKDQVFEKIRAAFLAGNAKDLSLYFDDKIEIMLDGHKSDYSQVQATLILKDFFEENPPKNFVYERQDSFKKGFNRLIGTYQSLNRRFQVYVLMKPVQQSLVIVSLDIHQE